MKKILFAVSAAILLAAPSVKAFEVVVDRVAGYYSGNGGEFNIARINPYTPPSGAYSASVVVADRYHILGYESFCMEHNENVSIPGIYNAAISSGAVNGGVSGGNPDPISIGTAWLYLQFAKGTLAGYIYTPGAGREASAALLQNAIWQLEGEITGQNTGNNAFLALAAGALSTDLTGLAADNNGAYLVGVLNLWNRDGSPAQDQLILLPDGGSALILLGFAFSSLALVSRKLRA